LAPVAVRFHEYELDESKRLLLRRRQPVDVGQLGLDLLIFLVRNRSRVVAKSELREEVWSGREIGPSTIPTAVNALRKALGDSAGSPELIQTIYGHGYRWIGPVSDPVGERLANAAARARKFYGRDLELSEVEASLEQPRTAPSPAIVFVGDPGIGKSRLLEESAVAARRRGCRVAIGRCAEVAGAPTLRPWHDVLEQLDIGELRELVSALSRPGIESRENVGAARFELLSEIAKGLEGAERDAPLVVAFDDLHCADVPTLLLLEGMVKAIRPEGVRFLGTFRPLGAAGRQFGVLRDIVGSPECVSLRLEGLSKPECAELVRARANFAEDSSLNTVLYERSGGNPFFVEQLVRQLNAKWSSDGDADLIADAMRIGPSIGTALRSGFAKLDTKSREILRAAAVIGRDFDLATLACLVEGQESEVLETLEEPLSEVIREGPVSGVYCFAHVLLRDAIYESIDPKVRASMHSRVLGKLRETHGELIGDVACLAARHSLALPTSETTAETISLLGVAADWSERNLGCEDAVSYLESALRIVERSGVGDAVVRAELLIRLGGAQRRSGSPDAAASSFKRAADLARLGSESEQFARAALGYAPGFFAIEAGVVDDQLIELLEEAYSCGEGCELGLRARIAGSLAIALYWSEQSQACIEYGEEAVKLADESGDAHVQAFATTAREVSRWGPKGAAERAGLAEWAIKLTEESGDREMELVYRLYRLTSLLQSGSFGTVWKELEVFSRKALSSLHGGALWYRDLLLALRAMMTGDWARAEILAKEFVRLGAAVCDRNAENCAVIHEAYRNIEYGSEERARDLIDEQARRYPRVRSYECGRVFLAAACGDVQEARRRLRRLVSAEEVRLPKTVEWLIGAALLSEACAIVRDKRRARVLFDALGSYEGEFVVVVYSVAVWRPVAYFLARLSDVLGRYEDAQRLFEEALRLSADAPPWAAHVRFGYAEMLRRRAWTGDGLMARKLALGAEEIASELSMRPLIARVRRFLWGPGGTRPSA